MLWETAMRTLTSIRVDIERPQRKRLTVLRSLGLFLEWMRALENEVRKAGF